MKSEPVLLIVLVGTAAVQGALGILVASGVDISPAMTAAITTAAGGLLAAWARSLVTPTASLPPGVAGEIADAKIAAKS